MLYEVITLTKPLGVGILTTAQKKGLLQAEHAQLAPEQMCRLNTPGRAFARLSGVHAMTDVTGFGLGGHLLEMCEGANLQANVDLAALPRLPALDHYLQQGSVPGGTLRNFDRNNFV